MAGNPQPLPVPAQPAATPPSPTLHGVSGEAIELEGGDVHAFSVAPAGLLVEWSTEPPGLGNIDQHGIYHAPAVVDTLRSVVVVAKTPGGAQFGTATITLSDAPRAIGRLGRFGVVVAAVLAIALVYLWSALNVKPRQPMVVIAPPEVTLDPEQDQNGFAFDATVFGDMKNGVTWSASDNGIDGKGLYKRPKKSISGPADVTITAASISDPSIKVTAIVHLVPHQDLAVHPASVSVFTSQQIPFSSRKNGRNRLEGQPVGSRHARRIDWRLHRARFRGPDRTAADHCHRSQDGGRERQP